MTEPIIPIDEKGNVDEWWVQVAETSAASGAVYIDLPEEIAVKSALLLGLAATPIAHIDHSGPTRLSANPVAVQPPPQTAPVAAAHSAPLWQVVGAGDVSEAHGAFLNSMHFAFRREALGDQIARHQLWGTTFIDITTNQFIEDAMSGGSGSIPTIVWIAEPDDMNECLHFWNLRALRSLRFGPAPMLILDPTDLPHWVGFANQFQGLLARRDEFHPDAVVCSWSASEEDLDLAARRLGLVRSSRSTASTGRRWPAPDRVAPYTFTTSTFLDPREWFIGARTYGSSTSFEANFREGRAKLAFESPVTWHSGGRLNVRIASPILDTVPRRDVIAQSAMPHAVWAQDALEFGTDARPRYQFDIQIPTVKEALTTMLASVSVEMHLSDKGRLASALIDDAGQVALPAVYGVLTQLVTPRSRELARRLSDLTREGRIDASAAEIVRSWGGRVERRYQSAGNLNGDSKMVISALERLCSTSWAERGLEVDCGSCGLRSFVPLREQTSSASCPACADSQTYSATGGGVTIYYRLNALVDRAVDQGVLPPLLVASALNRRDPNTYLIPGADIESQAEKIGEVDLLGIHNRMLFAGEVKTSPEAFTQAQLEDDIRKSSRIGADLHIMAAVGEISDAVIRLARELAERHGLQLLPLGKSELLPSSS